MDLLFSLGHEILEIFTFYDTFSRIKYNVSISLKLSRLISAFLSLLTMGHGHLLPVWVCVCTDQIVCMTSFFFYTFIIIKLISNSLYITVKVHHILSYAGLTALTLQRIIQFCFLWNLTIACCRFSPRHRRRRRLSSYRHRQPFSCYCCSVVTLAVCTFFCSQFL